MLCGDRQDEEGAALPEVGTPTISPLRSAGWTWDSSWSMTRSTAPPSKSQSVRHKEPPDISIAGASGDQKDAAVITPAAIEHGIKAGGSPT